MKKLLFVLSILSTYVLSLAPLKVNAQGYCTPLYSYGCCYGTYCYNITKVSIDTFTYKSKCSKNSYDTTNVSKPVVVLSPGKNYKINVQCPTASAIGYYIDWNHNGTFDFGEHPDSVAVPGSSNWTSTFKIPASAKPGKYRMRFRSDYQNNIRWFRSCIDLGLGEAEDYLILIQSNLYNDVGAQALVSPQSPGCGNKATPIQVAITNYGRSAQTKVPVTIEITPKSGGSKVVYTDTLRKTLGIFGSDTLTFAATLNTWSGNTYNFKIYTGLSTDSDHTNDTVLATASIYAGVDDPKLTGNTLCGNGRVKLYDTNAMGYTCFWYNSLTAPTWSAYGDTFITPFLSSATTYYAAYSTAYVYNMGAYSNSIGTGGNLNSYNYGEVMTVTKPVTLDSVTVYAASTGKVVVSLEDGSGNVVKSTTVLISTSGKNQIYVGMYIPAGNYTLTARGSTVTNLYRNNAGGAYPYSASGVLTITGNNAGGGGATNYYYWFYNWVLTGPGCFSNRIPVTAIVGKPAAVLMPGKPFKGAFSTGSIFSPDTISVGDSARYSIMPPLGKTNSNYGKKWKITNLTFATQYGYSSTDTAFTYPNSSANGSFTFVPKLATADSTFVLSYRASDSAGCDTTITRFIYVAPRPKAGFSFSGLCSDQPSTFTNSSTLASGLMHFIWNFGDGTTSTDFNPVHTYANGGTFTVKLKAISSGGAVDSLTKTVTLLDHPNPGFSTANVCAGQKMKFNDSSSIASGTIARRYLYFGDFSSPDTTNASPSHKYPKAGKYTVRLILTSDKGCIDTLDKVVTVYDKPMVSFTTDTTCAGKITHFKNTTIDSSGTALTYFWNFGDGNVSLVDSPTHLYTGGTNFNTTLVVTTAVGCSDSINQVVTVHPKPSAKVSVLNPCAGENAQFVDSSTLGISSTVTYSWSFGDSSYSIASRPNHEFVSAGTYTVSLTENTLFGCSNSSTQSIVIGTKPNADFNFHASGMTFFFIPVDTNSNSYSWDFGDGNTSNQKMPTHTYTKDSSFHVALTVTNGSGNCSANAVSMLVSTGIEDDAAQAVNLHIYPNPFRESVDIAYTLDKSGMVKAMLYDMTGRSIATLNASNQIQGSHTLHLNSSEYGMNGGMYILRMNIGDRVVTKQIIMVK